MPRIGLALQERVERAHSLPRPSLRRAAKRERLRDLVDHDADVRVRRDAPPHRERTDELLDDHARAERHHVARAPGAVRVGVPGAQLRRREEPERVEDGDQDAVVREVGVDGAVQRERRGVRVHSRVRRGVVRNRRAREACEELVGVADALHAPEAPAVSAVGR